MAKKTTVDFVGLSQSQAYALLNEWEAMLREIDQLKEEVSDATLLYNKLWRDTRGS